MAQANAIPNIREMMMDEEDEIDEDEEDLDDAEEDFMERRYYIDRRGG